MLVICSYINIMSPAPSFNKLDSFARSCIHVQLDIAKRVRRMQNRDYLLFDPNFHRIDVFTVGKFRVEIDALNRRAILCRAAQENFSVEEYVYYIRDHPLFKHIQIVDHKVFLLAKPHIRTLLVPADSDDEIAASLDKLSVSDKP